jgi:hypothetical protein
VRDCLALSVDGGGALIASESAMYDQDVLWEGSNLIGCILVSSRANSARVEVEAIA